MNKPEPPWTFREFAEAVDGLAPIALRAAATLKLADHIADGAESLDALAARAGVRPDVLSRLMAFLVCRGVFLEPATGVYALTEMSVVLLGGHSAGLRSWLASDGIGGRIDAALWSLLDVIRTGKPSYKTLFGRSFYDDLSGSTLAGPPFDMLRAQHASSLARELLGSTNWTSVRSVADIGGGVGVILEAILAANPHMHGVLVDRPDTVDAARARMAKGGPGARTRFVAGSFFDPLPADADVYLLVNVLHNWEDVAASNILRQCGLAAGPSGRILVVERPNSESIAQTGTAMDLRMLALLGGRERSLEEYRSLANSADVSIVLDTALSSGLHQLVMRRRANGPHGQQK